MGSKPINAHLDFKWTAALDRRLATRYQGGVSVQEIASGIGIPAPVVRRRLILLGVRKAALTPRVGIGGPHLSKQVDHKNEVESLRMLDAIMSGSSTTTRETKIPPEAPRAAEAWENIHGRKMSMQDTSRRMKLPVFRIYELLAGQKTHLDLKTAALASRAGVGTQLA